MMTKRTVLITGAAGRIGSFLTASYADCYDLRLTDIREPANTHGFPFIPADITDLDVMLNLCQDIDTVVHLAADPSMKAIWDNLLPKNIIGGYNLFEAAQQAGCRRIIFASSINAVFGYPQEVQVKTSMPVRPPNLYGATKAWGEAVARFYADQKNISAICLRFGWVVDRSDKNITIEHEHLDIALTYHDLAKLVAGSIEAPDALRFGIFHGVSNNRWKRLDISDARTMLGYEPEDDSFAIAQANQAAG